MSEIDKKYTNYRCTKPPSENFLWLRLNRDLCRNNSDIGARGELPSIIPAGSFTWIITKDNYEELIRDQSSEYVHPESNFYRANIPAYYFNIVEDNGGSVAQNYDVC